VWLSPSRIGHIQHFTAASWRRRHRAPQRRHAEHPDAEYCTPLVDPVDGEANGRRCACPVNRKLIDFAVTQYLFRRLENRWCVKIRGYGETRSRAVRRCPPFGTERLTCLLNQM
jgi:hypothetical protein